MARFLSTPHGPLGVNRGRGVCELRLSSFVHRSRGAPHPMVYGDVEFHIDREVRGRHSCGNVEVHMGQQEASHLAGTVQGAAVAVLPDVMGAADFVGLPIEARGFVAQILPRYKRDVAAWALREGAFWTQVRADVHVRMVSGEERVQLDAEEDHKEVDGHDEQPLPPSTDSMDGGDREEGRGVEAEEEKCSICLESLTRYGLPCSHSFHADCLGGWFQCKGECPLCRYQVVRRVG